MFVSSHTTGVLKCGCRDVSNCENGFVLNCTHVHDLFLCFFNESFPEFLRSFVKWTSRLHHWMQMTQCPNSTNVPSTWKTRKECISVSHRRELSSSRCAVSVSFGVCQLWLWSNSTYWIRFLLNLSLSCSYTEKNMAQEKTSASLSLFVHIKTDKLHKIQHMQSSKLWRVTLEML